MLGDIKLDSKRRFYILFIPLHFLVFNYSGLWQVIFCPSSSWWVQIKQHIKKSDVSQVFFYETFKNLDHCLKTSVAYHLSYRTTNHSFFKLHCQKSVSKQNNWMQINRGIWKYVKVFFTKFSFSTVEKRVDFPQGGLRNLAVYN